jgi:hypothetical protein
MESNFRTLQNENYQLREYILNLQSRLLENSNDYPPAPSHLRLSEGQTGSSAAGEASSAVEQQLRREMQHEGSHDAMRHLQAAAAQASEARPEQSPYGLGRPRSDEPSDAKPASS